MNYASGHFGEEEMADTPLGGRINFGGLTLSLTIGLATQDTTGQAAREVGLGEVRLVVSVRHGDTIRAATEVLGVEAAGDQADVTFRHYGINQHGEIVCRVNRTVRVRTRAARSSTDGTSPALATTVPTQG